jgi:hypothetical protein
VLLEKRQTNCQRRSKISHIWKISDRKDSAYHLRKKKSFDNAATFEKEKEIGSLLSNI